MQAGDMNDYGYHQAHEPVTSEIVSIVTINSYSRPDRYRIKTVYLGVGFTCSSTTCLVNCLFQTGFATANNFLVS